MIGSNHSLDTFRIKDFLTRNYQPYSQIDLERDADVQDLLGRFQLMITDLPVLICRRSIVLRNPTNQEIADCLGFNESIDRTHVRDLVVVGAGAAGLAAAVYAFRRARRARHRIGCSGRTSWSKFKDRKLPWFSYWHFRTRTGRKRLHAGAKFGAQMLIARNAEGLSCDRRPYALKLDGEEKIPARTVVIATVLNIARFNSRIYRIRGGRRLLQCNSHRSADVWW